MFSCEQTHSAHTASMTVRKRGLYTTDQRACVRACVCMSECEFLNWNEAAFFIFILFFELELVFFS